MHRPLVSVIIPAFNAEKTIGETLESVFRQSYPNVEIIVVDDGSTDNTSSLVENYAKSCLNIRYIRQENSGVAAARNTGIGASEGEYVAPLDADDLWHPRKLEFHIAALEDAGHQAAVAYSPFRVLNELGEVVDNSRMFAYSGDIFDLHLGDNFIGNGSGITARRNAVLEMGGYSTILHENGLEGGEDYLLQMQLARKYDFVAVPLYLIGYRVYEGSMSSNDLKMIKSMSMVYDYLQQNYDLNRSILQKGRTRLLKHYIGCACAKRDRYVTLINTISYGKEREETLLFLSLILRMLVYKTGGKLFKLCKKHLPHGADKYKFLNFDDFVDSPQE